MFDLLDKAMWSYIIKDIGKELEYLPYALFLGIIVYFVFKIILRKNSKSFYNFYKVIFLVYLFALVHITLFEREPGSRTAISLTLFETLGGFRNNAYVVENILLFIPYGFLLAILFRPMRNFVLCLAVGAMSSLTIETVQLLTQRGYFQVDDILMNSIGTVIGCAVFLIAAGSYRVCKWIITKYCESAKI